MAPEEIEAKFIEQEHRMLSILVNICNSSHYEKGDIRRRAAYNALFQKLLFGGGSVAIFGGLLAWATIYFSAQQTNLLREQNELIQIELNSNSDNLIQQKWADNLKRRSELIKLLYDVKDDSGEPEYSARERANGLVEYIALQSLISSISFEKFRSSGVMPPDTAMYKFGVDISESNLQKVKLSHIDFRNTVPHHANFSGAEIYWGNFSEVKLDWVNFSKANLRGSNFRDASLLAADLSYADLSEILWSDNTVVLYSNIHGVKNPPEGFVEWALKNGAVAMADTSEWEALRNRKLKSRD